MGGRVTFELVLRKPGVFAAAIPICGGANPATAKQLRKTRWWVFRDAKDEVIVPEFSQNMHCFKKAKAPVQFTLHPNANHKQTICFADTSIEEEKK